MKKLLVNFILFSLLFIVILLITLSTIGIETNKFNDFIKEKISKKKNINLEIKSIKFKIDPKQMSLFLETKNPSINYSNVTVPAQYLKVYIDVLSLIGSEPKIKKISILLEELDISQLNKLSILVKPSNFKSFLNNKIKEGKLISEVEVFLDKEGIFKNFIAKGTVEGLNIELINGLSFSKTNLSFFADKNDILIKNIFGNLEDFKIFDGDIKLNLDDGIKLESNFNSKISLDRNLLVKYEKFLNKYSFAKSIKFLQSDLRNSFSIELDNTYKIKDYNYKIDGLIEKSQFELSKPLKNEFITEEIREIYFSELKFQTTFSPKKINFNGDGKYSFDDINFLKFNLSNSLADNLTNLKLKFDFSKNLEVSLINYKKPKNSTAKIFLDLVKKNNNTKINILNYDEQKNKIMIKGLNLKNDIFLSFDQILVLTPNNDFKIDNEKKILIKGTKFDATNLFKSFDQNTNENDFKNLNSKIEIDFKNIKVPMSEKLENFKLIGEIEKGKFVKISSKGDFGGENYLDISMKKNKKNQKKYLEIYSDLTRPLLSEYSFFKGLSGGKLLYTSVIDGAKSNSKIQIENFKVINAPGIIQLLSLADLGGLEDLAKGEGLSFDTLEIDIENSEGFLKINEILALGPSMSVLMEGYRDKGGLTSLRGTLVPAKALNKMISKIPVLGDIVIPKEIGEGLFGISFKMKGPKGKIKTSINPIRTLTPRFIQKIIDKKKVK
jgi:hypothetical protein